MAAEELNMEKLEDLKRQVESLGCDEKQRNKLITEEWRRMREVEAEERNIAAEELRLAAQVEERRIAAKERRIAAEAEKRRLAAQAEERRTAAEAKERRLAAQAEERRIVAEERKAELD